MRSIYNVMRALKTITCFVLFFSCAFLIFAHENALAANPTTVNFQGKIVNADGTNVANSTYTFVFRLYDIASPTTTTTCAANTDCWWEETDTLTVTNGVFQVSLGATCVFSSACNSSHSGINFNTNNSLYLTMKFNGDSAGFMSPTVQFTSVPYAFNADSLNGIAASGFIQNSTSTQASSNFNISGTGIAGTSLQAPLVDTAAAGTLGIGTSNATSINLGTGSTGRAIAIGNTQGSTTIGLTTGAIATTQSTNGMTILTSTNTATALQIQNSNSQNVISAATNGMNSGSLVTNASIESSITGNWAAHNTGASVSQDTTANFALYGAASLKINSGSTTAGGAQQTLTTTLAANTAYNIFFYARANSIAATPPTIKAVYSVDGTTESVPCSNTLTLEYRSWQRYSCSFVTPASGMTASNALFIEATTASQTFYVDAVLVQPSSSADLNYREGQISIQGTINSPLIVQDQGDTTTAFMVQNKDGGQIFNVDSGDYNNRIDNPSFEVNTNNWSAVGTSPSIARDTSQAAYGIASLKVVSGTATNGGIRYTFPAALASGTYSISFSMLTTATGHSFVQVGYNNGTTDTFATCTSSTLTPSASASQAANVWVRYACNGVALTTPASILITSSTASQTFYVDGVQVELASSATSYGLGQISFGATIVTPVALQNITNSTRAFTIQTATGGQVLYADTANNFVTLGSGTGTNATIFVAGTKTDTGDPTCTLGGIYYNASGTADTEFRACRKNTAGTATWYNLIAGVDVQDYTQNATWTKPQNVSVVMVITCGGGGGGGGGAGSATTTVVREGGGGGGGGTQVERVMNAADVTSTVSVVVGASVTGGGGGTGASGTAGTQGNNSSFGSYVLASGGGGGAAGPSAAAANSGGGGGGMGNKGTTGSTGAVAGGDNSSNSLNGIGWAGGFGGTGNGGWAEQGGGGGAGASTTGSTGSSGGSSLVGGAGGGGGGGVTTGNVANTGGAGGASDTVTAGGGGGGGATAGGTGTAGSGGNSTHCGAGGGGGGGNTSGTGGTGGAGGATTSAAGSAGGGGGGGGGGTNTGGTGGAGARGEVWVFSW